MTKNQLIGSLRAHRVGMLRKQVELLDHQSSWRIAAEEVIAHLRTVLVVTSVEIHHIGSTSIAGIRAKPIIDLLGVASSLQEFDALQDRVEGAGFKWKGEYGIPERRYSVLYDDEERTGFVHFHVFEKGHNEVKTHLAFRDYLTSNSSVAKEYDQLKASLQAEFRTQREAYSAAKTDFIRSVLQRALR